jgi:uncharacterized protein YhfF
MTLEEVKKRYPNAEAFTLGDNRELCDWLTGLVRSGKKTASCGALRFFIEDGEAMPVVGRRDIVLDWDGNPALVIETTEVTHCRFCDVEEEFALSEGENEDLEGWQADHRRYFERNGGWHPEMDVVCERYHLIEDLG